MVAGIYFMKPLLMYIFSKVFTKIKSKLILSLLFVFLSAVLSAFLDALTVTAVLISVAIGFYGVYHKIHSGERDYNESGVKDKSELSGETLEEFQKFSTKFNHAWCCWYCSWRCLHASWRASKSINWRTNGMGFYRIFLTYGTHYNSCFICWINHY